MLAEILASNKSTLCRIASLKLSFVWKNLEKKKKKIEHDLSCISKHLLKVLVNSLVVWCSAAEAVETTVGFHVSQFRCSGCLVWCLCSLYNSGLLRFRLSAVPVI